MSDKTTPIPSFDSNGNLPTGEYLVTMDDIEYSLTWSPKRKLLFSGLAKAVKNLQDAGVRRIYVDGSFTSNKDDPGDIDGCWQPNNDIDMTVLDPVFLDRDPPREKMKQKYGVDFLIDGIDEGIDGKPIKDFFELSRDDDQKGILILEV